MFLEQAAERLELDVRNLTESETRLLITETLRDVNRAVVYSLFRDRDSEPMEQLCGARVRLKVCNYLRNQSLYKESDIRDMLSDEIYFRKPHYDLDVFQVGCIPYYSFVLFWHVQMYRNKRLTSMQGLPVRDFSGIEFRVTVTAESCESYK
ncbi:hypothetical protein [Agarivorans aestuarii]|uniref:WYL domain-containing protein n=1 Tax=Agarivorans aestuarii TaxID=1563703 RepID=A0ABU7G2Z8_9ALTE|nr:hypothetical protein [Agarivorans aestuarii]MEE1672850.1 hypothetical protein [Agarivorans aestuarii]